MDFLVPFDSRRKQFLDDLPHHFILRVTGDCGGSLVDKTDMSILIDCQYTVRKMGG